MIEISDVLKLIGNLKDGVEETKKFREFIEQDKWSNEQIRKWLEECVNKCSGPHDPYNRAFQDLVVSLGKRLGFEIQYGRYVGRSGEENYDGIWKRENGDIVVLEVKMSTWPIGSVAQLGNYLEEISRDNKNVFGLYVIGKGDVQPLIEQIVGSRYKDKMRLILYKDLIEVVNLKEKLEPVVGEKQAIDKVQNLLLPVESINIGNIVKLILEIATTAEEELEEVEKDIADGEELWTETELLSYLNEGLTLYQKLLLAALTQINEDATPKEVAFFMNELAKRNKISDIDSEITGKQVGGAKGGIKLRCKYLGKEDIIEREWNPAKKSFTLRIKERYKQTITDWVKKEGLWTG